MSELEKELLPPESAAQAPQQVEAHTPSEEQTPSEGAEVSSETSSEIEALHREVEYWKDQALRAAAEAENIRRRLLRENQQRLQQAQADLVSALLPLLNDLERGLQAAQNAPDLDKLREGLSLLQRQFLQTLQRLEIERIEPEIGSPPDPELHEILSTTPSEAPPNLIVEVVEAGYRFRGQLLRPARVIVSARE